MNFENSGRHNFETHPHHPPHLLIPSSEQLFLPLRASYQKIRSFHLSRELVSPATIRQIDTNEWEISLLRENDIVDSERCRFDKYTFLSKSFRFKFFWLETFK